MDYSWECVLDDFFFKLILWNNIVIVYFNEDIVNDIENNIGYDSCVVVMIWYNKNSYFFVFLKFYFLGILWFVCVVIYKLWYKNSIFCRWGGIFLYFLYIVNVMSLRVDFV